MALFRGATPERVLSGALLGLVSLDRACDLWLRDSAGHGTGMGYLAVDLLAFGVIFFVAIRANRLYPLWLGAAQIVRLISHLWRVSLADPLPRAHALFESAIVDIELAVLFVGLACHVHRQRRLGTSYPAWSDRQSQQGVSDGMAS